jgi:hypothetical protein
MSEKKVIGKKEVIKEKKLPGVSRNFVVVLSIVSILGFVGIASLTLFNLNLNSLMDFGIILTIGIGLIIEADIEKLKKIKRKGLESNNFARLITAILGGLSILTAILTFPWLGLNLPGFVPIKGVVSVLAIGFIAIQTWLLKQ